MRVAKRLDHFKAYLGTEMNIRLTKMREEGRDVINLGLGDPDVTPPQHLLDALGNAVCDPDHHHYPSFYSNKPLKEAIVGWYNRRFSVELDPETEVIPVLGASEGLFHIHQCLLDAGDVALVPDPSYPSYEAGVMLAGGKIEWVPLLRENGFLPDLEAIPNDVAKKARAGANFEQLVKLYTEDKNMKKKGGYLGYKNVRGRGSLSGEAHKLGPNKIGGPSKYRRGWAIFKTGKLREAQMLSYDEAKNQAKSKLKRELLAQARIDWVNELKEKYPVEIDEAKLKEI